MRITLLVNGAEHALDVPGDLPLLWALRDGLGLPGTKFGCGIGQCGACTVLLDGTPTRSCVLPVSAVGGRPVTTIEAWGDGSDVAALHPVQQAWIEGSVAQCGYCQSAQILTAVALLAEDPDPDDETIDRALGGVLCRCGTYPAIRRAVHRAAELAAGGESIVQDWDPAVAFAEVQGLPR
jgi:aerobic-type carbon monoxide dehydrogenase small subunit (CoxS/CutS family)